MPRKSRKRRSPARTVEEVGGAVWTCRPCQRGNRVDVLSKLKIRLLRLFERPLQILVLRQYSDDAVEPLKVLNRTLVDEPGLIRKNASQVNFPPLLRPSLICGTETIWQRIPWIGVSGWSHLDKRAGVAHSAAFAFHTFQKSWKIASNRQDSARPIRDHS
jgi:hypothetical protein